MLFADLHVESVSHEDARLQTRLGRQKLINITELIPYYVIEPKTIESKRAVPAGALLCDHCRLPADYQQAGCQQAGCQHAGALRRRRCADAQRLGISCDGHQL